MGWKKACHISSMKYALEEYQKRTKGYVQVSACVPLRQALEREFGNQVQLFKFMLVDNNRTTLRKEFLEKIGTAHCSVILACGQAEFLMQTLDIMEKEGFMDHGEYILINTQQGGNVDNVLTLINSLLTRGTLLNFAVLTHFFFL